MAKKKRSFYHTPSSGSPWRMGLPLVRNVFQIRSTCTGFELTDYSNHTRNSAHKFTIFFNFRMTIDRLQSENNSKQDKLIALQQRVTELITDKEGATTSDITIRSILSDSLVRISGALALATPTAS